MNRISEYRVMWIMVFFDLPTTEASERKAAALFRKQLQKDGFVMFQYSIYVRACASRESVDVHINRVKSFLPPKGDICIFSITDKQFGAIQTFHCLEKDDTDSTWQQLEFF